MPKKSLDNDEMIESTKSFTTLYESYWQPIYRFLYTRTQDIELSEDLTSNVFEKAWASRKSFHGGSARAWLYRIARNVLVDHWRKKQDWPLEDTESLADDTALTTAEQMDTALELRRLQTALDKLPPEMRLVIKLRFIAGLSSKQVARQMKLSDSNVRVLQYRALKKLKGYLK